MIVYVDATAGNDANAGTSPAEAWKTLTRVNRESFSPGDQILLKRGETWNEGIKLQGRASANNRIVLSTYGEGPRPRINGGKEHAITAETPISGWRIAGLELTSTNDLNPDERCFITGTCGISLSQDKLCQGLHIEDCLIHDTSGPGILLRATGIGKPEPIFEHVVVENCEVFNASMGIFLCAQRDEEWKNPDFSGFPEWKKKNPEFFPGFRVAHCVIHDILRDGMLLGHGNNGLVEHCTVYRTGMAVEPEDWPSFAIWLHTNNNSVIQFCEAYDNHDAGNVWDGGSFDLDLDCYNCIIQYNYSHDNDGGIMLCDSGSGCIVRYNLSINDGLANSYPGLLVGGTTDCQAYNNTCITRTTTPLWVVGGSGSLVANNIFLVISDQHVPLAKLQGDMSSHQFRNNLYYRTSGLPRAIIDNARLVKYDEFLAITKGEGELNLDPKLVDPLKGDVHLQSDSPCRSAGTRLPETGPRDYYGAKLNESGPVDMGCAAVENTSRI